MKNKRRTMICAAANRQMGIVMIYEMIMAFIATFMLAVIFNVNRRELIFNVNRRELVFCGIAGAAAEGVYQAVSYFSDGIPLPAIISAAAVTVMARSLANLRKSPVTVYLVPGIIPLVPGAGMYNTVFSMISADYAEALEIGIDTMKCASAIAIGIVLIFALPNRLFFKRR